MVPFWKAKTAVSFLKLQHGVTHNVHHDLLCCFTYEYLALHKISKQDITSFDWINMDHSTPGFCFSIQHMSSPVCIYLNWNYFQLYLPCFLLISDQRYLINIHEINFIRNEIIMFWANSSVWTSTHTIFVLLSWSITDRIFSVYNQWPLLLTWFNFNPSMDE